MILNLNIQQFTSGQGWIFANSAYVNTLALFDLNLYWEFIIRDLICSTKDFARNFGPLINRNYLTVVMLVPKC